MANSTLSELDTQPAPNPDAQNTVNDFLDYCEYFPSELLRSLRLIGDLDNNYLDSTQTIHELAKTYGRLPDIPANERPDPVALRKEIATTLDKAIRCRESAYAEATRLYEVAERHTQRLAIIKTKLRNQPQPPSRDPTPIPVSPQATRPLNRSYEKAPRLHLHLDSSRHITNVAPRQRDRSKKSAAHRAPQRRSAGSSDSDSDTGRPRNPKNSRPRTPGRVGTNVHSSIAGISTSNALAALSPPPPDAKPGSRFAPWFELTEYEMAVLRKQMKKNAIWRPSDTMIRRELERKGRGHTFFNKEKERCEKAGETMLDEPLDAPPPKAATPKVATPKAATPPPGDVPAAAHVPAEGNDVDMPDVDAEANAQSELQEDILLDGEQAPGVDVDQAADGNGDPAPVAAPVVDQPPVEPPRDSLKEDTATVNIGMKLNQAKEAKKVKRESQRVQAMRDVEMLEDATRKIREAAESLKELDFGAESVTSVTPVTQRKKSTAKASNKRKREPSPAPAVETPTDTTREPSLASQDSGSKQPERKRPRHLALQPIAAAPMPSSSSTAATPTVVVTPQAATPVAPSPVAPASAKTSPIAHSNAAASSTMLSPVVPPPEDPLPIPIDPDLETIGATKTTTVQIPLAPAGPGTPKPATKPASKTSSRHPTPTLPSPTENKKSPTLPPPPQPTATAASSRPRRETTAPKTADPPLPPAPAEQAESTEPAKPVKKQKTPTPAPEPGHIPVHVNRPRSARGHVPAPKAQSEEPKPNDTGRPTRELRRHSIFSQSAIAAPTRASTRKKPPPKGDITLAEPGQKTVTNVKRAQGSKSKAKKKGGAEPEPTEEEVEEEIDPNEPKYCICDDYSWGSMISCDNNCEKEWFHLSCVNLKKSEIPTRRGLWYCPDCREIKGTDQYGNCAVPPALPGRRGNR